MRILMVTLQREPDVVFTRQRARQIAQLLGFDAQDQTRIATAVSEIARNALTYAAGGNVEFHLEGQTRPQLLQISISDQGPGIPHLQAILAGQYQSPTGLGLGLRGAHRLMDQVYIASAPGQGTTVRLQKLLPHQAPLLTGRRLHQLVDTLTQQRPHDPLTEVQQQNQELLHTLEALRVRQDDLLRLNRELEDTNRGVVALYAELDEQAEHLRRADEIKSRFLSNMSHEFRTPVNSILSLTRLLLDHTDGPLTDEQTKQMSYIRTAAEALSELINDLLDLAKIEAGKLTVRPAPFAVSDLFSALRGMLRPLLVTDSVTLVFDEPEDLPFLTSDESKVSQILRNFLSNALKFTEQGEIRVSAALAPAGDEVVFAVADTGIGIAPEDQESIFEEFTQITHPIQQRVQGTGLGLPLCKKLAALLGGSVAVSSVPGVGSTFSATIPLHYREANTASAVTPDAWVRDSARVPVLIVEDHAETQFIYEKFLEGSRFQPLPARTLREAEEALARVRPQAIILDILLPGRDTWTFLATLKTQDATKDIPVLVVTALTDQRKGWALGADAYAIKPITRTWLLDALQQHTGQPPWPHVLVIDDEEMTRYIFKQLLDGAPYLVDEAASGPEGVQRAQCDRPQVIVLDLMMPGMDGYEVLRRLQADPVTHGIPVIIVTSHVLTPAERAQLAGQTAAILAKDTLSRVRLQDTLAAALGGAP
jgi:signal transduction histidine kinase/DNA-binding response OmpR family regulator